MVRYHQAHPHDSQLGYQQVQRGPWHLPPQAEIPQVQPLREYQLQHWWVCKDKRVAATQLYHLFGKYKLHQYPRLVRRPQGEPVLGPTDPAPMFWESRSNGLCAHSLLTTKELDLPQVESNLNKSPQEDLVVTVECIKV
jgi:hypothetical protein